MTQRAIQRRIVLNAKYQHEADEILAVTGIDSLSALFTAFLTRYGEHFKLTWKHNPEQCKYLSGDVQTSAVVLSSTSTVPEVFHQLDQGAALPPFPDF